VEGLAAEQDSGDAGKSGGRSFKSQMKSASSSGAAYACIIGPEELAKKSVAIKNMESGEQVLTLMEEAAEYLQSAFSKRGGL
jgi:histidyl-tRNA synthetase